jgi:hypothetical protein
MNYRCFASRIRPAPALLPAEVTIRCRSVPRHLTIGNGLKAWQEQQDAPAAAGLGEFPRDGHRRRGSSSMHEQPRVSALSARERPGYCRTAVPGQLTRNGGADLREAAINPPGLTDIAASQHGKPRALLLTPHFFLTHGGSDDQLHPHPAGRRARLLPGPSGCPLAGRIGVTVNDSQHAPRIVRQQAADTNLRSTAKMASLAISARRRAAGYRLDAAFRRSAAARRHG